MRTIVAGNWKMHKDRAEALAFIGSLKSVNVPTGVEVIIAPPFPFLAMAVEELKGTSFLVAAQNCHGKKQGAFTGEVSAGMLKSIGVQACIVGHSERREYFGETDAAIGEKIIALLEQGMTPIFCCGERKEERIAERHFDVVIAQMKGALGGLSDDAMKRIVVAYEPVWAIGTGLTATAQQAQEMHACIRTLLNLHSAEVANTVPILYGGSCKPDNAAELFANADVNGGLIGGAALDTVQFAVIIRIAGQGT